MLQPRKVKIGNVAIGGGEPLAFIAGPCVIESEKAAFRAAEKLKEICSAAGVPLVFKASYDKANRTSFSSFRGVGLKRGLNILKKVRERFGVPVTSDVHSVEEVFAAGGVLDCLQIPAFLCRQTDLLLAAGRTKKAVNIKKGQFLAPWNMNEVVKKVVSCGNKNILLTERGVSFGYNNLVVDLRSLDIMRRLGYPVVFDATHSVQLPGAQGASSGGERQYVASLARAAAAFGCDALFLEVHEDPDRAPCDGPNMLSWGDFQDLIPIIKELDRMTSENKSRSR